MGRRRGAAVALARILGAKIVKVVLGAVGGTVGSRHVVGTNDVVGQHAGVAVYKAAKRGDTLQSGRRANDHRVGIGEDVEPVAGATLLGRVTSAWERALGCSHLMVCAGLGVSAEAFTPVLNAK